MSRLPLIQKVTPSWTRGGVPAWNQNVPPSWTRERHTHTHIHTHTGEEEYYWYSYDDSHVDIVNDWEPEHEEHVQAQAAKDAAKASIFDVAAEPALMQAELEQADVGGEVAVRVVVWTGSPIHTLVEEVAKEGEREGEIVEAVVSRKRQRGE
jgi:hypothetical protein